MQLIEIPIQSGRTARIAHSGENEAVQVAFSLAPFQEAFPGGRPALLVRRKGDAQAYPVTLTVEGDTAYWTVTAADTAAAGFGQCELQWYAGDTLAKSDKFDFLVVQALEAGAEPPDEPSKRWFGAIQAQIGDLDDLTTKAKENLVAAINEAAKTGSGGAGSIDMQVSGGYIQYSADDGTTWENLIAVADLKGEPGEKGEPGADGYSPSATVSTINGGARIVIEDKNGTTAATIMNGTRGPKGDPGDDYVLTDADKAEIANDVIAELGDAPLPAPASAAVGQFIKVKTVADGKVTETEAADVSGGGEAMQKLYDGTITVAEAVTMIEVDMASSATLKDAELFVHFDANTAEDWGGNKLIDIVINGAKIGYYAVSARLNNIYEVAARISYQGIGLLEISQNAAKLSTNQTPMKAAVMPDGYAQTGTGKLSIKFAAPYAGAVKVLLFGRY